MRVLNALNVYKSHCIQMNRGSNSAGTQFRRQVFRAILGVEFLGGRVWVSAKIKVK